MSQCSHRSGKYSFQRCAVNLHLGYIKAQVQLAKTRGWIDPVLTGKVSDEASMYLRMAGEEYEYMSDVEDAYEAAHEGQKDAEKKDSGKNNGGGGGGGGSKVNGSNLPVTIGGSINGEDENNMTIMGDVTDEKVTPETNLEGHPEAPFKDVTAEYSWAQDSIDRLRKYNIIHGDGAGNFRPGEGIKREEFLKLLLEVFGIDVDETAKAEFADVKTGEWYYGYVATAYKMGIVTGYDANTFGIGDIVTRADMAVMLLRVINAKEIVLDTNVRAQAFTDFDAIPEYARYSASILQQAGIVQGDTFGNFMPGKELTRAESAVVFVKFFNETNDFIIHSWEKIY